MAAALRPTRSASSSSSSLFFSIEGSSSYADGLLRIHLPGTQSVSFQKFPNGRGMNPIRCGSTNPKVLEGSITNVEGLRFAVVSGRFNEFVTRALVSGALSAFKSYSVKESDIDVVWVPGAFEIPITAQALAKSGRYHAVLCIGTVIRGDTTHYDAVANSAASGVLSAGLSTGVPCIFGVLTCDTLEQHGREADG